MAAVASTSSASSLSLDLRLTGQRLTNFGSSAPSRVSTIRRGCPGAKAVLAAPANRSSIDKMKGREKRRIREPVTHDKLDRWMNESIGQIVSKIGEAPFLVRIFSDEASPCTLRLETEAAVTEEWEGIKERWEQERRTPDAIVLVDELECEELSDEKDDDEHKLGSAGAVAWTPRRTWGLAVQGRGAECPSCYILDTNRVKSSFGLCTHFCLARAKCFGEPWELQLRNAWLQGR